MKVVLLGTGDSPGTPVINCHCRTCEDARRKGWERKRFSILIQDSNLNVLIDTSPDLRRQLLENKIEKIDAVIWTHCHYDHFGGFGEFYRVQDNVKVYTTPQIHDAINRYMHFMSYEAIEVNPYEKFEIGGISFELVLVNHPPVDAVGVVAECDGYKISISGDTNIKIPEKSIEDMSSPDLFVVDAIAPSGKFRKHMNAYEALQLSKRLKAKRTIFSHMSHLFPPIEEAKKIYPIGEDYQSFNFGDGLERFLGD